MRPGVVTEGRTPTERIIRKGLREAGLFCFQMGQSPFVGCEEKSKLKKKQNLEERGAIIYGAKYRRNRIVLDPRHWSLSEHWKGSGTLPPQNMTEEREGT